MFLDSYDHRYADAHDVMGFVIDGLIVCDGYAYTYQWLLDYLGVESMVVYGNSTSNGKLEGHAWNKVKIDGKWYNVDVCWSDTGCGRNYFLKSDDYFKSHYHTFEDDYLLPNFRAESNYGK
jgi:transglutaminase/protease-like cytokinesis protein 3